MNQNLIAMMECDALAAGQFMDTCKRTFDGEPEKMLLLAVLQDAIHCFRRYGAARDRASLARFCEVQRWIMVPNSDWIFSFANICETLGLDPQYVRRGLLQWHGHQVSRKKATKGDGLRRRAA